MPLFKRKRGEHRAAVYDTRPIPGDKHQFEAYFIAICDCGWAGDARESSDEALRDAYEHTPTVEEVVQRPVG